MRAIDIRNKYLKFFEKHNHKIISGASLIPENDSSVLFTPAGMHPLIPYLLGEKHPDRKKNSKPPNMYKNYRYRWSRRYMSFNMLWNDGELVFGRLF